MTDQCGSTAILESRRNPLGVAPGRAVDQQQRGLAVALPPRQRLRDNADTLDSLRFEHVRRRFSRWPPYGFTERAQKKLVQSALVKFGRLRRQAHHRARTRNTRHFSPAQGLFVTIGLALYKFSTSCVGYCVGPNLLHQWRIVSYETTIPHSARRSSTSRKLRQNR